MMVDHYKKLAVSTGCPAVVHRIEEAADAIGRPKLMMGSDLTTTTDLLTRFRLETQEEHWASPKYITF